MDKHVMFNATELKDIRVCVNVAMGYMDTKIKKQKDPVIRIGMIAQQGKYEKLLDKIEALLPMKFIECFKEKGKMKMEIQKIAELVSKKIYNVSETETDFAVQLLIEKLIIPQDVKNYTADDAKKYILEALSKNIVNNSCVVCQKVTTNERCYKIDEEKKAIQDLTLEANVYYYVLRRRFGKQNRKDDRG